MKLNKLAVLISFLVCPWTSYAASYSVSNENHVEDDDITVVGDEVSGSSGIAISVNNNGTVEFNGTVEAKSVGDSAKAMSVTNNSEAVFNGNVTLESTGNGASHALQVYNNSRVTFTGSAEITTSGTASYGLNASGLNANIDINGNAKITTDGDSSIAVYAASNSNISLGSGSEIATAGKNAYGIYSNGNNGSSTLTAENLSVSTQGGSAHGVYSANGNAVINLSGDNFVETFGAGAYGIVSSKDQSLIDIDGKVVIVTSGDRSSGAVASASEINLGDNSIISTKGNNAYGVSTKAGVVNANNLIVSTEGNNASGINSYNNSEISLNGSGNITTKGENSNGAYATESSGINIGNTDIDVSGKNSHALNSVSNSSINLNKSGGYVYALNGSSFLARGGVINAILDNVSVLNNGSLIDSQIDSDNNLGDITLTVQNTSLISGDVQVDNGSSGKLTLNNSGWKGSATNATEINLDELSTWYLTSSSDAQFINNSGTIILNDSGVGNNLTIHNDYHGDDGHIVFNGKLEGDNSIVDKLIVNGNTSGSTLVSVNNIGGNGDKTINGIELISVAGDSSGIFEQNGRIVAGAYEYHLITRDGNWYLVNNNEVSAPDSKLDPSARPEGGSYVANLSAANTLFNTRLHDRVGETWYRDPVTGQEQHSSLWMRQVGSHNKWRDGSGQLKTQANSYVAQLGGDLAQWSTNGENEGHLGLMMGYANSHNSTKSSRTGYGSKGSLNGYSVGLYTTWFENKNEDTGLYLDSWLQYSWFRNHVNGQGLASESYKSKGMTASLETGYSIKFNEFSGSKGGVNEWFVQPQAQVTWMGVKANEHRELNGSLVKGHGEGNVQTRLGVRTFLRSQRTVDTGIQRSFEPFVEVNWLHNSRDFSATMDGANISESGSRNLGELKAGVEAKLNPSLNIWGNVGTRVGTKGYMDSTTMIGVKYNF
ncbi:autotransporter outer membrane beta-barrel domain-containing protein [Citrobacter farmeri]|uniref:autotransporter outer membrane beta-barrel domain-containing protein n=1 Tax=Citrobacter farmeri TaxID=67824 RepID=UPI001F2A3FBF|nr:autotransporter outer membrane beta-barrel domain-containing protein [Citrobacter farmeri]